MKKLISGEKRIHKNTNKYDNVMNGIALWTSYYRANTHVFVEEYLNIKLKLFQKLLLYQMNNSNYFMFIAARGLGKSFLTAIYAVCRAILYPESKIVVAAKVMKQSREVIEKIGEIMVNSDNLKREISDFKTGLNDSYVTFKNGSWIKTVVASDNARGRRGNVLIVDEFRMVDEDIIKTVLRKFLANPRFPKYLYKEEYSNLLERNKEMYLSSGWLRVNFMCKGEV